MSKIRPDQLDKYMDDDERPFYPKKKKIKKFKKQDE